MEGMRRARRRGTSCSSTSALIAFVSHPNFTDLHCSAVSTPASPRALPSPPAKSGLTLLC